MRALLLLLETLLHWLWFPARGERALARGARVDEEWALHQPTREDEERFRVEMERLEHVPHVVLGRVGDVPYRLGLDAIRGVHAHTVAQPGAGKSRLLVSLIIQMVRLMWFADASFSAVLVDAKGETVGLMLRALAELLATVDANEAARLAARIVVIRPFTGSHLVPLRLFERERSVDLLAQGRVTVETLERASGAAVGIRQSVAGTMAFATLIGADISPVEMPFVMRDASAMRALAERVDEPRLRAYFRSGDYDRESRTTIWGLIARLEAVLGIAPLRAMLAGPQGYSFRRSFESNVLTLVDLEGAPVGAQAIAEAVGALVTTRLVWAGFDQSIPGRARGTALVFDELARIAVPSVIEGVERVLTTGRSFGLSLISAAQFSGQVPELDRLLSANVRMRFFGRTSVREIEGAAAEWLPLTGREPKPRRPGEPHRALELMSEAEETRHWTRRLSRLPVRQFLVGDRSAPFRSRIVEALPTDPPAWGALPSGARELVERGGFGIERGELLRRLREMEVQAADRVGATRAAPPGVTADPSDELPNVAQRRAGRSRRRAVP